MSTRQSFIQAHSHQILYWALAMLMIALGVVFTHIDFLHEEWLSRAGCLIVMLGIWSGLGVLVQEKLLLARLRRGRRNALLETRAEFELTPLNSPELDQALEEINQVFDQRTLELTQNLKLSLGVLEVSLLITGTFFWGFGDLFFH